MPLALVHACQVMLPRLAAEEALEAVNRTAVGSGAAEEDDARRALGAWEKDANGPQPAASRTQLSDAALGSMGIGRRRVRVAKREAPPAEPPAQVD